MEVYQGSIDRLAVIELLKTQLVEIPEVIVAYLFGSVARGDFRASSDVDVGVLYAEDPPQTLEGLGLDLQTDLSRALGGIPVQLVVLNRTSVELRHRVLRDSVLLKDTDTSSRIQFETKARRE